MRVNSKKRLREFWTVYPKAESPLNKWYREAKVAKWSSFADTRKTLPDADQVKVRSRKVATIFNVAKTGNRIISEINYQFGTIYVRFVLTHDEYEKGTWKDKL